MSTAAHTGVIRGQGTSTAFVLEPTTKLTANTRYQLNTDLKRLIDPAVAVVVEVDADGAGGGGYVVANPSTYTVNYLFGIITFLADQGAPALVRVSGSYLPVIDLLGVTSWEFTCMRTVLDNTTLPAAGGWRTKQLGLKDVTGSLEVNELITIDHDPGAGTLILQNSHENGTPFLFERSVGGRRFRAWMLLESTAMDGGIDGLVNNNVNFTGAARAAGAGYGWEA
ncbi:MAG: hypothetical protein Q8K32_31350 [Archangium sp.]|nr:hypothetical protein [Archangium sp.]